METNVKRREWVKTAAIIFLAVMLVLTFFSNTILNHSLPEVATANVTSGTINAKIRGSGTVSANETYDVTIKQTRKVASVKVRVGDSVSAGDVLMTLEAEESDELKQAQTELESMELSYEKSLIAASTEAVSPKIASSIMFWGQLPRISSTVTPTAFSATSAAHTISIIRP